MFTHIFLIVSGKYSEKWKKFGRKLLLFTNLLCIILCLNLIFKTVRKTFLGKLFIYSQPEFHERRTSLMIMKVHSVAILISSRNASRKPWKIKFFCWWRKISIFWCGNISPKSERTTQCPKFNAIHKQQSEAEQKFVMRKKLFSSRLMQKHFYQVSPILWCFSEKKQQHRLMY